MGICGDCILCCCCKDKRSMGICGDCILNCSPPETGLCIICWCCCKDAQLTGTCEYGIPCCCCKDSQPACGCCIDCNILWSAGIFNMFCWVVTWLGLGADWFGQIRLCCVPIWMWELVSWELLVGDRLVQETSIWGLPMEDGLGLARLELDVESPVEWKESLWDNLGFSSFSDLWAETIKRL